MLNSRQQAEVDHLRDKLKPLALWHGGAAELVTRPTPLTAAIVTHALNKPELYLRAGQLVRWPLYPFTQPLMVTVLGRTYLNLNAENQLFFGNCRVRLDAKNAGSKPQTTLVWSLANVVSALTYLIQNLPLQLKVTQPAQLLNTVKARQAALKKITAEAVGGKKLDELTRLFERVMTQVVAVGFLDGLLEGYVQVGVKPHYSERWPQIEAAMWQQYRQEDEYFQSTRAMVRVAEGLMPLEEYLQRYGSRSFNDFELAAPRFWEIPEKVAALIHTAGKAKEIETRAKDMVKLKPSDRPLLETAFAIKAIRGSMRLNVLTLIDKLRQAALQRGRELHLPQELVFYATLPEVLEGNVDKVKAQERLEAAQEDEKVELPDLILGGKLEEVREEASNTLVRMTGLSLSAGKARGELVKVASEFVSLSGEGSRIYFFPDASPRFSHLYPRAKGIIVASGGMASHGAILAREYHIPAVSLGGKKLTIKEGQTVEVDGDEGKINLS